MRWLQLGVVICAVTFAACGDDSPTSPDASGNFTIMLKDSPFSDARAVLVTFTSVSVHRAGEGGFTSLGSGTRTCDLKKLETAQDILGVGTLPEGHYTQVRMVVSSAALYFDNPSAGSACAPSIATPSGRSATIEIPSGEIKLNREFDVPATGTSTMLIDFDGDKSIRELGNGRFMMQPVVDVVNVQ